MDGNFSLVKRKSLLDPENILNLQLLRRRLGVLPIHVIYCKARSFTWIETGTRVETRTVTGIWNRAGTGAAIWAGNRNKTWTFTETLTKTRTGTCNNSRTDTEI